MKYLLTLLLAAVFSTVAFSQSEVKIGKQVWMKKNLDVDKFRNGDPIPEAKDKQEWEYAAENKLPAWCYLEFKIGNGTKNEKLYNWYAVNDIRGLAPVGYHVPSLMEWEELIDFLGGENVAGKKLKSKTGWRKKGNGDNSSGFNGEAIGYCRLNGDFEEINQEGVWWSRTSSDFTNAYAMSIYYTKNRADLNSFYAKFWGMSVRCIKDIIE